MIRTNSAGIALIEEFEGFRPEAYWDLGGVWTIGYGSTHGVLPGMEITKQKAADWLLRDIGEVEKQISRVVNVSLTHNEISALVSLVYNIGIGNFKKSTLLKKLNTGDKQEAADEFLCWDHIGEQKIEGLHRRRKREQELFLLVD